MNKKTRKEQDALGEKLIPEERLWGIHTMRALENFRISEEKTDPLLIKALATVKKACILSNMEKSFLDKRKALPMIRACDEIIGGAHKKEFPLDALQGGAGTSLNMNMNEVIANRAVQVSDLENSEVDPIMDVNMHQSTNDVFPTSVKVASIAALRDLSSSIERLQGVLQKKEKEFAKVIKTGRTEMREAVPITLGAEFSAFAEMIARDRWRIYKCEERLRKVNLGGTAVGTGLTAPREYIFLVIEKLRELTAFGLMRGENAVDQTANSDVFLEVAGILKTHASNVMKMSNDLRLLSFFGEIVLQRVQAGSSIMPGKSNPVILECAIQGALKSASELELVFQTVSRSSFQINEFLPLLSSSLLKAIQTLKNINVMLVVHFEKIKADKKTCQRYVDNNPLIITAFLPSLGYKKVEALLEEFLSSAQENMRSFLGKKLGEDLTERTLSPENFMRMGDPR